MNRFFPEVSDIHVLRGILSSEALLWSLLNVHQPTLEADVWPEREIQTRTRMHFARLYFLKRPPFVKSKQAMLRATYQQPVILHLNRGFLNSLKLCRSAFQVVHGNSHLNIRCLGFVTIRMFCNRNLIVEKTRGCDTVICFFRTSRSVQSWGADFDRWIRFRLT